MPLFVFLNINIQKTESFFFSSRRRHTRSTRDWSSDVCSSDLKFPAKFSKSAVEQGDIRFFELAALSVDLKVKSREVSLKLTDFVVSPDDIPEDVRRAIKHWGQYVDYWAVDWDHKGDTFHNQWQTYRTRKNPK